MSTIVRLTYKQQLAALLADPSVKDLHKQVAKKMDSMDSVDCLAIADALQELQLVRHQELCVLCEKCGA